SPDRCAASPPGNSVTLRSAPEADASRLALRLARLQAGSQSHTAERDISFSYTFSPYIDPAYVESMMNY
ncbi:hypothetical protein, partial [Klebsiella oxytoca]|uniref:hypothetical protein n=4 Tax=Klebsiella TaxID=570 RepID=UPI001D0EB43D